MRIFLILVIALILFLIPMSILSNKGAGPPQRIETQLFIT